MSDLVTFPLTAEAARRFHVEHRDTVPVWTIYGPGTTDHPGRYVARPFLSRTRQVSQHAILADTLEETRATLPPGLFCLGRQPGDDPNILECWI